MVTTKKDNRMNRHDRGTACCGQTPARQETPALSLDTLALQIPARLWRKTDKVWLTLALVLGLIALLAPAQWLPSLNATLGSLVHMLPFIALSAGLASYLEVAGADRLIGRAFGHRASLAIVVAAVLGALSPFCSCGVIPLVAALLVAGVPLSAVMAFWIASPIMSPAMFVVTAAGLGMNFAIAKTLAAIGIGLFAGFSTHVLQKLGYFTSALKLAPAPACAATTGTPRWAIWQDAVLRAKFAHKSVNMVTFLLKWLSLAFLLESLMVSYLPAELLLTYLGADASYAVPLAALLGVPAYLNGFAAVPLLSGLMQSGMAPGAAMSFILAGAITSLPAALAVYSLVKTPLFILYLLQALLGAILAGYLYQNLAF
jgi:uncharacterized protein